MTDPKYAHATDNGRYYTDPAGGPDRDRRGGPLRVDVQTEHQTVLGLGDRRRQHRFPHTGGEQTRPALVDVRGDRQAFGGERLIGHRDTFRFDRFFGDAGPQGRVRLRPRSPVVQIGVGVRGELEKGEAFVVAGAATPGGPVVGFSIGAVAMKVGGVKSVRNEITVRP